MSARRFVFAIPLALAFSAITFAAEPHKVNLKQSSVSFSSAFESATFDGHFEEFGGSVVLSEKNHLQEITLNFLLASARTGQDDRDQTLLSEPFFLAEQFPHAKFVSTKIIRKSDSSISIDGVLSINNIEQSISIDATIASLKPYTLSGSTQINRLDFGVGLEDFTSAELIPLAVPIKFNLAFE